MLPHAPFVALLPLSGSEEEVLSAQMAVLQVRAALIQQLVALDAAFEPPPDYTVGCCEGACVYACACMYV